MKTKNLRINILLVMAFLSNAVWADNGVGLFGGSRPAPSSGNLKKDCARAKSTVDDLSNGQDVALMNSATDHLKALEYSKQAQFRNTQVELAKGQDYLGVGNTIGAKCAEMALEAQRVCVEEFEKTQEVTQSEVDAVIEAVKELDVTERKCAAQSGVVAQENNGSSISFLDRLLNLFRRSPSDESDSQSPPPEREETAFNWSDEK